MASALAPATAHLPIEQHPIPQTDTLLCWAATSQMVIEHFFPVPQRPNFSQWTLSGYRAAGVDGWLALPPVTSVDLEAKISACELNHDPCNVVSTPRLLGLTRKFRTTPLKKAEIKRELGIEKRPFMFQWFLPDSSGGERASGNHYFIATGYDDRPDGFTLTIWDPWPVATTTQVTRVPERITLQQYRSPKSIMGVDATYAETFWQIGLRTTRAMMSGPPPRRRPRPRRVPSRGGVSLSRAAAASLSASQRTRLLRRLQERHGSAAVIGTPFPIVAADIDALRTARDKPLSLLEARSRAVLYPVIVKEKVVGSFLMSWGAGRWSQRGYASTTITALAHEWRRIAAQRRGLPLDPFYLVSAPEVRGFFVGVGEGQRAELIPVSDDRQMGLREGTPRRALDVLGRVVARAQQLTSDKPGAPPRPR